MKTQAEILTGESKVTDIAKSKPIERSIGLQFHVSSDAWGKFLVLKAQSNALKNQVEGQRESFGFTPKNELVTQYGLEPLDKVTVPIVNGNGAQVGKVTYYWQDEKVIPAGWAMRIS